ncbi:hypothetical protein PPYR_06346 [Photinus pyralis]|uniref:CLIP domain-containing serine protease n=1 Tax=Photinus pyralis TaxID=7054 RepID=A0A1Y1K9U3_PHOPY|nr:serine protease easter-like [Photinus pyralis]KAB0800606.1 hypothetical protein PPYR_06346 [Photinus pyralis]
MTKSQISCGNFFNYFTIIVLLGKIHGGSAQCTTPNEKRGNCIPIRECPALLGILEKGVINPDEIQLLQQSQCGYIRNQPKVCCEVETSQPVNPDVQTSELLPAPGVCGKILAPRIVGGKVARLDEFQWMALIEYSKPTGRGFHCGGALISDRYVLTAAHCIKNIPRGWRLVSVRLGEHNLQSDIDCEEYCADPPQNVAVEESIPHELYDPKSIHRYNDVAVLRLQRPVAFTDYIFPICLPSTQNTAYAGLTMTVAGWGRTENRSQSVSKMKLDVPVRPQQECISTYQKAKVELREGQICAGGVKGKDSCTGDSGGPLMYVNQTEFDQIYFITGIVSFGPSNCGLQDWPGVYTKVVDYIPWIINKLKP